MNFTGGNHLSPSLLLLIKESVCVSGYAFRHASRYGAWHGGEMGPRGSKPYFRSDPIKVKGHPEIKLSLEYPMATEVW